MNIKLAPFYCGIVCFSLAAIYASGQKKSSGWNATSWTHSSKNCHHLLSTPAQCKWVFPEMKATAEGTVIEYDQMQKNEKTPYAASVAILKTGKDTVRVLLLNDFATYKTGQRLKILQEKEPNTDATVPLDRDYYISQEKKGARPVCRINSYDERIAKTVWGRVIN